ncbi:hypothetical protein ANN_05007 [Periplaneta americana]|uniref:Mos1 transposase HTH domain-containing protein n=1 Tax=Periplaneta americana TaxID=6978 RepID=A0ABQ8T9Y2_PERAM|nr:hypothetical protein ANN_05007 [Periplaneta americana]
MNFFVWSVVLNGAETWTSRRSEEKRIEAFEMQEEIYGGFSASYTELGRQHSLKCAKGKRCSPVCPVVQQEEIESIPSSSYESTMVHCVYRGSYFTTLYQHLSYLESECDEDNNAGDMIPGSSTESYPAFAHIGLRENSGKNLNQIARGKNARQCHTALLEACGRETLSYRTVARWVHAFRCGREDVHQKPRAGRTAFLSHCGQRTASRTPATAAGTPAETVIISPLPLHVLIVTVTITMKRKSGGRQVVRGPLVRLLVFTQPLVATNMRKSYARAGGSPSCGDIITVSAGVPAAVPGVRAAVRWPQCERKAMHCHNEVETLAHVLGSCPHGEGLRSATHHQVRSIIATALKDADYNTFEEVYGLSVTGSTRRIDIIAFKESTRSGFIIDPTVRFETNEEQPAEVDKEKRIFTILPFHITFKITS